MNARQRAREEFLRYAHAMSEHSTALLGLMRAREGFSLMNSPYVGRPEIRYRFCSTILFLSPFYVKYDREESIWGEIGNCHLHPWPNLVSGKLSYLYLLYKMSSNVVGGLCTAEEKRQLHSAANLAAIYGFAEGARVRHAR